MNGLYYYKLISPYAEDVTKDCKLTINEIDSNFFNLKGNDIDSAEFNRHHKMIVLTRKNGEKLYIDLSSAAYDLSITETDGENGKNITFSYESNDGKKTVTIENVMTSENIAKYIKKNANLVTDDTLSGFGNSDSPLGIKRTEKTGMFSPAIGIIDITRGGKLPKEPKVGTRFLTKEYLDDFGYLYNGKAVDKINKELEEDGRGWRVPTKEDWDKLLNSVEPCGYDNHDSARCHIDLGKFAGKLLKSECGWVGQKECGCGITMPNRGFRVENESDSYVDAYEFNSEWSEESLKCPNDKMDVKTGCECNCHESDKKHDHCHGDKLDDSTGVDRYGMTILPSGFASLDSYGRPQPNEYKEKAYFWTSTHINGRSDEDVYVKVFQWNKGTVSQIAECPMPYYGLRLVKDYNGTNFNGSEYIDGTLYNTVLSSKSGQVWLASNYVGTTGLVPMVVGGRTPEYVEVNGGQANKKRKEIFINEWNGTCWVKKLLHEGDTIVLENPYFDEPLKNDGKIEWTDSEGYTHLVDVEKPIEKLHNIEYRVYTCSNNCDKELVNTDNLVFERVIDAVLTMFDESNKEIRKKLDEIEKRIDDELSARLEATDELKDLIEAEANDRKKTDNELWSSINGEIERAQDVESDLWNGINGEIERAQSVEGELWNGINGESERAQSVEAELWNGINGESERAQDVEQQLWTAVNNVSKDLTEKVDKVDGELIKADENYVMNVYTGLKLIQKNGNIIEINFDGNYGEIGIL